MSDKVDINLDFVIELVKAEPELDDNMPDEIWDVIKSDRKKAENALKNLVKATKRNIIDRIKSVYGE